MAAGGSGWDASNTSLTCLGGRTGGDPQTPDLITAFMIKASRGVERGVSMQALDANWVPPNIAR